MVHMINLYAYDDYRKLLADLYQQYCEDHPGTSARRFAAAAGFSNPGFYNDVVRGVRKLSREATAKLIAVFGWNAKQAEFFRLLVEWGQEKDPSIREQVYAKLQSRRSRSLFARMQPDKARYYQDISYPLVRSAVDAGRFSQEDELVRLFKGKMSATLVRQALRDLLDWGLVVRDAHGVFQVVDKFVEPAPTMGLQVRRLNAEWLKQGELALDSIPPEKRHISTMLLTVGPETHRKILDRIAAFRTELFELAQSDSSVDRVVQMSMAYFTHCGSEDEV